MEVHDVIARCEEGEASVQARLSAPDAEPKGKINEAFAAITLVCLHHSGSPKLGLPEHIVTVKAVRLPMDTPSVRQMRYSQRACCI
jgi:hypothetical protein